MNIYVGNLPNSLTEDELRAAFEAYGEVTTANIITDRFTRQSKGFGFVEMPNKTEAEAAINGLNEANMDGRNIRVNEAKPREERPPRRQRY